MRVLLDSASGERSDPAAMCTQVYRPEGAVLPGRVLWRYRGPVVRCSCSHFPQGGEWECFEMGSEAEGFASGVEHHAGGERVASLCLQAA